MKSRNIRNIRNTRILSAMGLLLCSSIAIAQNNPQNLLPSPPIAVVPSPTQSLGIPYPMAHSTQPTVDVPANTFLPSMSQNIAALVGYDQLFWQMQQNGLSGATAPYKSAITASANNNLVPTITTTIQNSTNLTLQNVQGILAWHFDSSIATSKYALTPGTDIQPPSGNTLNDFAFNADNILGVTGNSTKSSTDVSNLVAFLSGAANPIGGLTLSTDATTLQNQLNQDSVKSYLVEARSAAAAQSVAMSNLNYLAQERQIVPGLGSAASMTTLPTDGTESSIPDASQLQLEQFLVDRRVGNANWYASMNSASSIALQRETLFILAEISKQMYQQKVLMERLLAQQVAMAQQTAQINRTKISYDQQTVQQNLTSPSS